MTGYNAFLKSKALTVQTNGRDVEDHEINPVLFPFQRDGVRFLVRKGRGAGFFDTGLGKTIMQVESARLLGGRALIIAPLAVVKQTVDEARALLGVTVTPVRSGGEILHDAITGDIGGADIYITNYEMISHFDPAAFQTVILDESSILKNLDGKTRRMLTEMFRDVPHRLCFTATPAPNDITEIGRHAEFLGVMSNAEMLAAFFINDMKQKDGVYRLKKHATAKFYRWLASWSISVKKPSDLGYSDDGYVLPPLSVDSIIVDANYTPEGMLPGFHSDISATDAKRIRRQTIGERVRRAAELANGNDEQWIIWAGLNDEADALTSAIPGAVNVHGSMTPDQKADYIASFTKGAIRVLVTKTSIAGFGINMQNAHNMIFCGIDYSWESYYQAVRRCWRFGQQNPVRVYVITSKQEQSVLEAVQHKEREAIAMTEELVKHSARWTQDELRHMHHDDWHYSTDEASGENWRLMLGDSCERIDEIASESVDLSVFSPPFISLYTYTPTERDLGNSRDEAEFFGQFGFIIDGLLRITKPGRNCCVHVQQVAATKSGDGFIGIKDFRGDVIRAFVDAGWIFHGEITVDKNPQVQAIRTKTKGLMFSQLHKDSVSNRPAFADYVLIFQKPGENAVPVIPDVTNDEWITWAHPVWYDIRESDVLNVAVARSEEDERHMCPLQLPLIERLVRLYTNKGETVFSPFAGIGSELYEAVRLKRRGLGIELKPEYFAVAKRNLRSAETQSTQGTLFELFTEATGS